MGTILPFIISQPDLHENIDLKAAQEFIDNGTGPLSFPSSHAAFSILPSSQAEFVVYPDIQVDIQSINYLFNDKLNHNNFPDHAISSNSHHPHDNIHPL